MSIIFGVITVIVFGNLFEDNQSHGWTTTQFFTGLFLIEAYMFVLIIRARMGIED